MLQIFFIAAYFIFFGCLAVAEEKVPQTLEQINADLKAKKAAMEPFDPKQVKVDIESLGLDDVDKKAAEKKVEIKLSLPDVNSDQKTKEINPSQTKPNEPKTKDQKQLPQAINKVPNELPNKPAQNAADTKETFINKVQNKVQDFLNQKKSTTPELEKEKIKNEKLIEKVLPETTETAKKISTEKYINSTKKKNLKKRLEFEKQRKANEKRRQQNSKKLKELREKYLIKTEENIDEDSSQEKQNLLEIDKEKIIPQKKDINKFASEEMPPLPILNRFRTPDNLHIPSIPTTAEKIAVLFSAVSKGDVAYFNSAYQVVGNPDIKNNLNDSVLSYAVLLQKHDIISSLLAKGANPNLPNSLGYSPIAIAIELFDLKSLEFLVNSNAQINYIDGFGRTYLMHAARVGFLSAVELFVSRGVDINAMDNDGFTALSIAHRHKNDIVEMFLLKNGAKTWIEKPYNPKQESMIKELENHWR